MANAAPRRALAVVGAFAATLALGLLFLIAFEPGVQQVDAEELVARRGEARAFLIADYVFVVLYALVSPVTRRRFGQALGPPGLGRWLRWAPPLLLAAGVFDAIENTLLLAATDSPSGGAVGRARRSRPEDRVLRRRDPRLARHSRTRPSGARKQRRSDRTAIGALSGLSSSSEALAVSV